MVGHTLSYALGLNDATHVAFKHYSLIKSSDGDRFAIGYTLGGPPLRTHHSWLFIRKGRGPMGFPSPDALEKEALD
jgi:hypothetical protein